MRRPKTPSIPCVLAYLLLFGLVSAWGFQGTEDCPPSSCGQLHNITYPFRLKGDPAKCGEPGYVLTCDRNRAVLEFNLGKYYVQEIFYENTTIWVTYFGLARGACALPSPKLSPSTIDYSNDEGLELLDGSWASFVNCTRESRNQFYSPVPCLSRNNTNTFVYATNGHQVAKLATSCGFLAVFPTIGYLDMEKDIFEQLQQGFMLQWRSDIEMLPWRSDIETVRSWKYWAHYCFEEASRQFVRDRQARNMIIWMPSPLSFEANFLKCLENNKGEYHHSNAAIGVAVVLIVLFDVAAPLLVIALLGRFVLAPLAVVAFLAYEFRKNQAPPIDDVEKFLRNQQGLAPKEVWLHRYNRDDTPLQG